MLEKASVSAEQQCPATKRVNKDVMADGKRKTDTVHTEQTIWQGVTSVELVDRMKS
jgi:hypothetical protein